MPRRRAKAFSVLAFSTAIAISGVAQAQSAPNPEPLVI